MASPLAVIVGDSQAQGAGAALEKRLTADGYNVKRWSKPGASSAGVAQLVLDHAGEAPNPALVVVYSGSTAGSVNGLVPAATAVRAAWPDAQVYWYGSAPATKILSLSAARAAFGSKVTDENYWFSSGEAADREKRNSELPSLLFDDFRYIDWRSLDLPGAVVQLSGVIFPSLPDGIHILGPTATAAASSANWPPPAGPVLASDSAGAGEALALVLLLLMIKFVVLK